MLAWHLQADGIVQGRGAPGGEETKMDKGRKRPGGDAEGMHVESRVQSRA